MSEEDAMFTRKPLQGLTCASCEKDVFNIYGKKADYIPWGKLPYREPSERIARVGKGFSKMLSLVNPDLISRYESNMKVVDPHGIRSQRVSQERPYNPINEEDDNVIISDFEKP